MKRIITFLTLIVISCTPYRYTSQGHSETLKRYRDALDNDRCILLNMEQWNSYAVGYRATKHYVWSRHQTWTTPGSSVLEETGISLASSSDKGSHKILESNGQKKHTNSGFTQEYLVYVGPWRKVIFNYPSPVWNRKTEEKEIRLYAYQRFGEYKNEYTKYDLDRIEYVYEEANSENKKIPEMPLKLIRETSEKHDLCKLQWQIKHGYNAVAEYYYKPLPGFWNWLAGNKELILTGKIIEAKE